MQGRRGARVLHLGGGPMDTCFGNLARGRGREYAWTRDQVETADNYRRYRTLMAHMRAQYPDQIHDVRHDELADDTGAALREAIEFCGLRWVDRYAEAAAGQAGAPMPEWRRYEAGVAPLRQRVGGWLNYERAHEQGKTSVGKKRV